MIRTPSLPRALRRSARQAGCVVVQVPDMLPTEGRCAHHVAPSLIEGARLAGSLDSSIADQAQLWAALVRGWGLSPASRAQLIAHAAESVLS